jgi:hypothetical protein
MSRNIESCSDDASSCLWCASPSSGAPPEHIIPECLGCPPGAVFSRGEVCARCNNRLSRLDSVLCEAFDVPRYVAGQRGKRGAAPAITGRSNIRTVAHRGEYALWTNLDDIDHYAPSGHNLKRPVNDPRSVRGSFQIDGEFARTTLHAQMFYQPEFPRAMHKVAIETIALFGGVGAARVPSLDAAREFTMKGVGPSRILLLKEPSNEDPKNYRHHLRPPYTLDSDEGRAVEMVLCGLTFLVDCSPKQAGARRLMGLREFSPTRIPWYVIP